MRIALLSWESLHSISVGGVAAHVTELGAALERKGNDVHVFTRLGPGQSHYQLIDGVHYHRCPFALHSNFVDEVNNMCRSFVHYVFTTENLLGPFDVVHAHDWLAANAMIWIKQGRRRKSIMTFHSTEYGRCGNHFYNGQPARVRFQERAASDWADRVITVSKSLKKEIMWMYEAPEWKVRPIYNAVNPQHFEGWLNPGEVKARYGIGPMDPMVLFVGRLEFQKGPDVLVETIPGLLKHYPTAKFVFAGDGEMRRGLESRTRQLGVAQATRFLGFKNGHELPELYKACDVVCVPSRNEPFGIVVLEGWSAGKPVVVSKNGGPDEYVSHEVNGLKISPTSQSVGWGLGTLFTDFDWARWMGRNGRVAVESGFTWDHVADRVLDVYCN
jgi:glycosyltransferase involved in cell wall biosynthesis